VDPAELQRLVDHERADAAALERMRERSLLRQAHEEGHLAGVLASLRAQAWDATVQTIAGRTHHGPVAAVATDCCSLAGRAGVVHLPYTGVASVRAAPLGPGDTDHLVDPDPVLSGDTFADLVARLAEDRAHVAIGLPAGALIVGVLVAASSDLVTVAGASVSYVALPAVVELTVRTG
jgi:hypothetical protein